MEKNNSTKKNNNAAFDKLCDRYSLYSTNPGVKVTSQKCESDRFKKASCNLEGAMDFLYTDSKGKPRADYIADKSLHGGPIAICKIGNKNYLTDNGETFKKLSAKGMKKAGFMKLLRTVDSDYDIKLVNDELCMEIEDPTYLTDCYRNMVNVLAKIRCLTEAGK